MTSRRRTSPFFSNAIRNLSVFHTLMAYATSFDGEPINVIYSGEHHRRQGGLGNGSALPRAWVAGWRPFVRGSPAGRCFWMLLTSGFRTYRFLPVFWRDFYPCFKLPVPPDCQRLLNELARQRFGSQFDPALGIVRFARPQRLKCDLQEVPGERTRDPHIAYFLSRNPGHGDGDELVCLTELCSENLTSAGRRMTGLQTDVAVYANR